MTARSKPLLWIFCVLGVALVLAIAHVERGRRRVGFVSGAVIRQDADQQKQIPLAGVDIVPFGDVPDGEYKSDSQGLFRVPLGVGAKPGQHITLLFRHAGYKPIGVNVAAGSKILVVHMEPLAGQVAEHSDVVVANVDVRYSISSTAVVNVGSVVKTFAVVNTGNVPCRGQKPCSPDDKWKATLGSLSLDAGQGNEFQNVRVSCIAGPCPFTRINPPHYSQNGRNLKVSALDWSDTATFLLEAEVDHAAASQVGRETYPVTYGDALNFTLPPGAEGVYVEAEMKGTPTIFPLGPDFLLDWADCNARFNRDQTTSIQCALKPGYRFKD